MNPDAVDSESVFVFAGQLIESRVLFSGLGPNPGGNEDWDWRDRPDWLVIDDFSLADEYATSQNPAIPGAQVWGDLRQVEAGRLPWVKGLYQQWEEGTGRDVYRYLASFGIEEAVATDIDGDLYHLGLMDCFLPQDRFWKRLKEAYSHGGWPCGWVGPNDLNDSSGSNDSSGPDGSAGKLVVFNPRKFSGID